MALYRADRDEQLGADLSIRQMLGDTLEHLGLSSRHTRRRPYLSHLLDSPPISRPAPKEAAGPRGINPEESPWTGPGAACAEHVHRISPSPGEQRATGEDQPRYSPQRGHSCRPAPAGQYGAPESQIAVSLRASPASAPSQRAPGRSPPPMIRDMTAPFALVADVPSWQDPVPRSFTMRCPARRQQPEEGREARAAMMIAASPASPMASGPARCPALSGRSSARKERLQECSASGQRSPMRPGAATLP